MSLIIPANSAAASGGYAVDNSCRFDGSSSYLTKTGSSGNRKVFTFSTWLKRSTLTAGAEQIIGQSSETSGNDTFRILFDAGGTPDQIRVFSSNGNMNKIPSMKFRDTSAWYHVVMAFDTTQSTAADRNKIYVNGNLITDFSTSVDVDINTSFEFNIPNEHTIGRNGYTNTEFFGGYMAETVLIDGTQYAASDFGEFDEDSGIWKPIDVSGLTAGTNGFYLDFEASGNLGNDVFGGTDLTENNIAAVDQTTDTPTNNFATMNNLDNFWQGFAFSDGNTTVTTTNASQSYSTSSIMVSSGKWYVECKPVSGGSEPEIGVAIKMVGVNDGNNAQLSYNANGYAYRASDPGTVWYNGTAVSTGFSQYANGDIIGIALDLDNNKLYFSKNGTFGNSGDPTSGATGTGAISIIAPTSTTLGAYAFAMNETFNDQNKVFSWNFGNPAFAISSGNTDGNGYGNFEYAVPSGYYSLNTKNLAEYG